MNDFYKDYASRKQHEGVPSAPGIAQRWSAMTAAKKVIAVCLLLGLLAVGGCGVAAMTGALDSPPTARECQEERDQSEIEGWPQAMVQGAFENCRREWQEAEGIKP
jgi:hypothetical protein